MVPLAIVVALSIALCLPLEEFRWFGSCAKMDYLLGTVEYGDALRHGVLFPRWAPDLYGGYGSPWPTFYAPFGNLVASMLMLVFPSPIRALKIVIVAAAIAGGTGVYAFVKDRTQRIDAAFLAACVFVAAPFRIADLYHRGDVAEFIALCLLPWAFWGYSRCASDPDTGRATRAALVASLVHAAVVLSHTLLGLWGTILIAVWLAANVWPLWRRRALPQLLLLGTALGWAMIMSFVYTLPALKHRPDAHLADLTTPNFNPAVNAITFEQLYSRGWYFSLHVIVLAVVLVLAGVLMRKRMVPALGWLGLALACLYLVLPQGTIFWDREWLPFAKMMQFPWRLMGPMFLALALSIGYAWAGVVPHAGVVPQWVAVFLATACVLVTVRSTLTGEPKEYPNRLHLDPEQIRAANESASGVADEYLPAAVKKRPDKPRTAVAESTPEITVLGHDSESVTHTLVVNVKKPGRLVLALHWFPGWRISDQSGPAPVELLNADSGHVGLQFRSAGEYRLQVRFGSTPLVLGSSLLSLLGLLSLWPVLKGQARLFRRKPPLELGPAPAPNPA